MHVFLAVAPACLPSCSVRQSLQAQGVQPTAAFPAGAMQPTSPADPFRVINALTMVPEEGMVSVSSISVSSTSRRRVRRRVRQAQKQGLKSPYLGAVVRVRTVTDRCYYCFRLPGRDRARCTASDEILQLRTHVLNRQQTHIPRCIPR